MAGFFQTGFCGEK